LDLKDSLKANYIAQANLFIKQESIIDKAIDSLSQLSKSGIEEEFLIKDIITELQNKKTMIDFYKNKGQEWDTDIYINTLIETEVEIDTPHVLPAYLLLHIHHYDPDIKNSLKNIIKGRSEKEKIDIGIYIEKA
jgi:hypothetical protein